MSNLVVRISALKDEICDFMEENNLNDFEMDIEDAELALKTIQDLRSEYRIMNKELEMVLPDYEENYRKTLVSTLETITNFIKDMKRHKQKLKMNTINTDLEKDSRKVEFIVEEII